MRQGSYIFLYIDYYNRTFLITSLDLLIYSFQLLIERIGVGVFSLLLRYSAEVGFF